jgi:hypothetical protein
VSVSHALKLPYPPYLRGVVLASAMAWLLVRVTYGVVLIVGALFFGAPPVSGGIEAAVNPVLAARAAIIAVATSLVWIRGWLAREHLLHANLAASVLWIVVASLLSAGLLELAAGALLAFR